VKPERAAVPPQTRRQSVSSPLRRQPACVAGAEPPWLGLRRPHSAPVPHQASSALARSRKAKVGYELVCERLFRPLAHLVVAPLLRLRVPPPLVAAASGATGVVAAVELVQGRFLLAALLVQLKTLLDNADGQLARLSGRITPLGRYLDSELDLVVNAALFAAVGWSTGQNVLSAAGFVALTTVLSVNYNVERLYRAERGEPASPMPETAGRVDGLLRRLYVLLYAPQDRLVERFVARRLRGASPQARLAYHDRATVTVLANLGMSTQLVLFGICIALARPAAFAWVVLGELALVLVLAFRRELVLRSFASREEESPAPRVEAHPTAGLAPERLAAAPSRRGG
jgi:archaetidylinositol phosphate synthase